MVATQLTQSFSYMLENVHASPCTGGSSALYDQNGSLFKL